MIGRWDLDARRQSVAARGWWRSHKWWLARRSSQVAAMAVFMAGPWLGLWLVRGNFASSEVGGVLPLSDPYLLLQSAAAGHGLARAALIGAGLILALYLIVGGRAYCAWVCPVNVVTDSAHWLRERTGLTRDRKLDRRTRLVILAATLLAALLTGAIAWEFVNPVSMMQRGLITGVGLGWGIVLAVFLLDLFVARRAWCSHLCPVGAFYGLVGRVSLTRVAAVRRAACTDCAACFNICPEPHVIAPALKGTGSPVIRSGDCLNCGACIDSCPVDVFRMTHRFAGVDERMPAKPARTRRAAVTPGTAPTADPAG